MTDRYAVFGNPIGHSKSPAIHAAFAAQTHQAIRYEAILAPLDGFARAVGEFAATGGRGANVTVPFKEEAHRLATRLSPRAVRAGAVNTLSFDAEGIAGDNTDGAGLVADLQGNLGFALAGRRVLLLGAGGAARGVAGPLLDAGVAQLFIANRNPVRAHELARLFSPHGEVSGHGLGEIRGSFDLVINATAASLAGESLALPPGSYAPGALAYDMMYGRDETPFLLAARALGAARGADGLGMLVEQAAEAFLHWRGLRPDTAPVLADLRARLAAA
ncbi:MAG: shikimate dehydrogenase [Azonexus sp.]|nr:shikimate dehydrogenase [Betaproteobacteria bacterium]MBK8919361.1 shikimate dehydrogenase [Betaproteobacteria bacterium]MBP6037232.1 shikimate dehydrogenase [Azonexus sp.]MBP6907775.1 shikimate dehydrogenase [Azonexus sp.]